MPDDRGLQARPVGPVVRAAELCLWREAAAALENAVTEAASLRGTATDAYEAERRRGYDEGREQAATEVARRLLAMEQAANAANREVEAALPGLVCDIIETILGEREPAELLRRAVRHALGRMRRGASASLRASPDCQAALRAAIDEMPHGADGLRLEVDPALAPGRCLFESELGVVELGVEAQLRLLRETMTERWEQAA